MCLSLSRLLSLFLSMAMSFSFDSVLFFRSFRPFLTLSSYFARSVLFLHSLHPLLSPGLWILFFLLSEFVSTSSSVHSHSQFADCIVGELLILLNLITFLNIRIVCNFFLALTLNDFKMNSFFSICAKPNRKPRANKLKIKISHFWFELNVNTLLNWCINYGFRWHSR